MSYLTNALRAVPGFPNRLPIAESFHRCIYQLLNSVLVNLDF